MLIHPRKKKNIKVWSTVLAGKFRVVVVVQFIITSKNASKSVVHVQIDEEMFFA